MLLGLCQGEAVASLVSIAALLGLNACVAVSALFQFVFRISEHTCPTWHICLLTMSQQLTPEPKLSSRGTISTLQVVPVVPVVQVLPVVPVCTHSASSHATGCALTPCMIILQ